MHKKPLKPNNRPFDREELAYRERAKFLVFVLLIKRFQFLASLEIVRLNLSIDSIAPTNLV